MGSLDLGLDAIDLFCGMGGSSSGLVEAGFQVRVALNHFPTAIQTHAANHPDTEHLCADIQAIDLRYLPRTRLLWASPICTEVSPAGGRKRRRAEHDLFEEFGHVPDAAFERTRVTFWEVLRAAEIHRQDAILIENVVEAFDWQLMPVFLDGLERLGYQWQVVSVSAAHVGDELNPFAPQWRDRIYIQALRKGIPMPKLEPRPKAFCFKCDHVVDSVQQWKPIKGKRAKLWYRELPVGKYNQQYFYACPVPTHGRVEPFVLPAVAAIDWSDLGTRIGDRKRPLSAATMRRIEVGRQMITSGQFSFSMAYGGRSAPIDLGASPMRTWTTAETEAMVSHPLLVAAAGNTYDAASGKGGNYVRVWPGEGSPLPPATTTAGVGLAIPPAASEAFVAMLRNHGGVHPVTADPLATFTSGGYHHGLVIPYRKGADPYPAQGGPLSTFATHAQHGVLNALEESPIEDYYFRMLKPREAANAQRFDRGYVIHGNQGEQQQQAGNAVPVNVAHWLGRQTAAAVDGSSSPTFEHITGSGSAGAGKQRRASPTPTRAAVTRSR